MINVRDKNAINATLFEANQYGREYVMHKVIDTRLRSSHFKFRCKHMV